jgi:hypothetical protein
MHTCAVCNARGGGVGWRVARGALTCLWCLDLNRLPTETIKWSGGFLLLPGKTSPEAGGNAVDYVNNQCSELDVYYASWCCAVESQPELASLISTPFANAPSSGVGAE